MTGTQETLKCSLSETAENETPAVVLTLTTLLAKKSIFFFNICFDSDSESLILY